MQLYSNCISLNAGGTCYLYTNPGLTLLASAGKYSDGTNCFTVNSSGLITAVNSCVSGITITVYYNDTQSCTGDSIVVKKNSVTMVTLSSSGNNNFSAVNGDSIDITVTPGSGGVGCNTVSVDVSDSSGTFINNDNIGVGGPINNNFVVGSGNSGNITINGYVAAVV